MKHFTFVRRFMGQYTISFDRCDAELHREWLDGDDALEVDILSCLLESIETALLTMQSA